MVSSSQGQGIADQGDLSTYIRLKVGRAIIKGLAKRAPRGVIANVALTYGLDRKTISRIEDQIRQQAGKEGAINMNCYRASNCERPTNPIIALKCEVLAITRRGCGPFVA